MGADRLFGAAVCVLALAFLVAGVPTISDDWMRAAGAQYFTIGPRLFPYIAGLLCLLFGAAILGRPQREGHGVFLTDGLVRRRVVLLALLALAYAALLGILGFTVASILAMALFMVGFGMRRWTVVLPVAVLLPVLVGLAFERLLQLRLPAGIFGLTLS